ncbi:MAG: hypothetical protein J7549_15105 [Variovorax sp.]|nr:hypothetical protein [Variovorax sp.]
MELPLLSRNFISPLPRLTLNIFERTAVDLNYEPLVKIASIVLGIFPVWKVAVDIARGRYGDQREGYRFAREFLNDLSNDPDMHPFLREKGYQALAGDHSLAAGEVAYLLTLKGSPQALKDYVLGRPYLEYLTTATGSKIRLRPKYAGEFDRRWRKTLYFSLFLISYFLSFAPVVLRALGLIGLGQVLPLLVVSASVFLTFAVFAVKEHIRISRAEILAQGQTRIVNESLRSLRSA